MNTGEDYKYELRCEDVQGANKPFIISSKAEQYQTDENDEFILSFLNKLQITIDKLK